MVIMKGTSRIFDKPLEEQEGSTSGLKVLSIYGVKSYDELINIPIEIRCSSIVGTQTNININSLGSKNLVFQGSTTLPDTWTSTGLIYRIMYNGSNFQLLSYSSGGSSEGSNTLTIPLTVLNLTNESTSEEITEAFGGASNIQTFIEAIISNKLVLLGGDSTITSLETSLVENEDGTTITEMIKLLMTDSKQIRIIKLTRNKTVTNAYTSAVVTNEDLGGNLLLKNIIPKNAGAHNGIYRGEDITDLFYDGTLSQQIAAGTFDDIFIGDCIIGKTSGRKYLVADINYRLNMGDTECKTPHILMIPERIMGNAQMNSSDITTEAYIGSDMYKTNLAQFKTVIQNDFGSGHILNHRELLTNAVTHGKSSGWAWYDSTIELMNESMVYGHNAWGSHHGYETGIDKSQLSLFKHKPDLIVALNDTGSRHWYWLRDVVSSSNFALVDNYGGAAIGYASSSLGVRPAFLIY